MRASTDTVTAMGCAASTSVTEPRSAKIPEGCVEVLETVDVPEIGVAAVDRILQKGSSIFNTLAEINCSMTDRVACIKERAQVDPETTNLQGAIKVILNGLPADAMNGLKGIIPCVNIDGLLEGNLEFDLPIPEDLLSCVDGTGLSEIARLGIDMVKACEDKLPDVVSDSAELTKQLGELEDFVSSPDELKEHLEQSGLLIGNPLHDGLAVLKAVSSLKKGISACGKIPAAVDKVASNFKICCESVVMAFKEHNALQDPPPAVSLRVASSKSALSMKYIVSTEVDDPHASLIAAS